MVNGDLKKKFLANVLVLTKENYILKYRIKLMLQIELTQIIEKKIFVQKSESVYGG